MVKVETLMLVVSSGGWKKCWLERWMRECHVCLCLYTFCPGCSGHGIEQSQADEQTGQFYKIILNGFRFRPRLFRAEAKLDLDGVFCTQHLPEGGLDD